VVLAVQLHGVASGDFDRDELVAKLEKLFSNWPFVGERPPPVPTNTTFASPGVYLLNKDVNQGRVSMLLPASSATIRIISPSW